MCSISQWTQLTELYAVILVDQHIMIGTIRHALIINQINLRTDIHPSCEQWLMSCLGLFPCLRSDTDGTILWKDFADPPRNALSILWSNSPVKCLRLWVIIAYLYFVQFTNRIKQILYVTTFCMSPMLTCPPAFRLEHYCSQQPSHQSVSPICMLFSLGNFSLS